MKLVIPENKKWLHRLRMPIRWGDMDALGHVNNRMYFHYMECVRIEWLHLVGYPVGGPAKEGLVICNAFCNFYNQLKYPADILLNLYVSQPGRASFDNWVTIERVDQPGEIYAGGGATAVWLDYTTGKSKPIPEELRDLLSDESISSFTPWTPGGVGAGEGNRTLV